MGQADRYETSPGYALKRAQAALHARMEADLRPLGLTVSQYACLEQLARRPGISHAELARSTFVSRQSANVVLRGLEERDLVRRDRDAADGRAVPTELTPTGRELVVRARRRVDAIDAELGEALGRSAATVTRALNAVADHLGHPG